MSTTSYTSALVAGSANSTETHTVQTKGAVASNPILVRLYASALLGLTLHHLVFRKGEWHLKAPLLLKIWLMSYPLLFVAELGLGAKSFGTSISNTLLTLGCFTMASFASIAVYRLFFHRLGAFPGPVVARATKLWHASRCLQGQNHLVLDELHRRYGDYVRTGPNEITVFHPEVLLKLDGPGNKTTKSAWYDFLMPDMGVTTIRNKAFHDQRRQIWTRAFSAKALPNYEEQMVEHAGKLEKLIQAAARDGKPVSFSSYAYWFSFDVMGMFALSQSFNMLHDEKWHYAVGNLRRAMSLLGPLSPVPWLAQIGFEYLSGYWLVKDWHSMRKWCRTRIEDRIRVDHDSAQSVASYLIADAKKKGSLQSDHYLLAGEAIVAIVAGSDTVAPTLVFLFYELALNPSQADKLYEELKIVDINDRQVLQELPHLNALINETLRFHPAVPTGGYRDSPPEGMTIGGRYIPGNTTIVAPRYTINRLESCYQQADKFVPERWYSRPEMVKDSRSFLPFAQGRYTCLGKALALSELRVVTSLLVSKYRIRFAPGNDGSRVEQDMRDQFTAAPGQLDLVFEPRM